MNECATCYSNFFNIKDFVNNNDVIFICKNSTKRNSVHFITKYLPYFDEDYKVIVSDSLYNNLSNEFTSEIIIYSDDRMTKYLHTTIDDFAKNLDRYCLLISGSPEILEIYSLPDSLYVSESVKLCSTAGSLAMLDKKFNQLTFLSKVDDSITFDRTIDFSDYDIKSLYLSYFGNDSVYKLFEKYKGGLKLVNKDQATVRDFYADSNYIYVLINLPHLYVEKESMSVDAVFVVLKYQNGQLLNTYPVYEDRTDKYFPSEKDFFVMNDTFFFSCNNPYFSDTIPPYIFEKCVLKSGAIYDEKVLDFQLPDFYLNHKLGYNFLSKIISYPYIFFSFTTDYINVENGVRYNLPLSKNDFVFDSVGMKLYYDYAIHSTTKREGNKLEIITVDDELNYFYSIVQLQKNSLILSPVMLKSLDPKSKSTFIRLNDESLLYINKDNKLISLKI